MKISDQTQWMQEILPRDDCAIALDAISQDDLGRAALFACRPAVFAR
ncbi:MAG: hypothetical protein H3C50_08105 [Kiritimatiellae bacterium]|nr:hypothetical protein [Kiritimatiellia bacterium]MCO5045572.1 hypothetical protein [Kiritimatiellia bacterium]